MKTVDFSTSWQHPQEINVDQRSPRYRAAQKAFAKKMDELEKLYTDQIFFSLGEGGGKLMKRMIADGFDRALALAWASKLVNDARNDLGPQKNA